MGLDDLPFDVLFEVSICLDPGDIVSLAATNHYLRRVARHDFLCRRVIEVRYAQTERRSVTNAAKRCAPYSREVMAFKDIPDSKSVGCWKDVLWRVHNRRQAISSGVPRSISSLGRANSFVYSQGVMCHLNHDIVTVIDTNTARGSISVSLADIFHIDWTVTDDNEEHRWSLVHYSASMISLVRKASNVSWQAWPHDNRLYVVKLDFENPQRTRPLGSVQLPSVDGIFVRNDAHYMYWGTMIDRELVVWETALTSSKGLPSERLDRMEVMKIGWAERDEVKVGSTLALEIFDGYCYAVTSLQDGIRGIWARPTNGPYGQADADIEPYGAYSCAVFPVGKPTPAQARENSIYRRELAAGPLDDGWSNLKISRDESDGHLNIVETRREWLGGSSQASRSFYTTELWFPERFEYEHERLLRLDAGRILRAGDRNWLNDNRRIHAHRECRNTEVTASSEAGSRTFIRSHQKYGTYDENSNTSINIVADYQCCSGSPGEPCLRVRSCSRAAKPGVLSGSTDTRDLDDETTWTLECKDHPLSDFAQQRLTQVVERSDYTYSKISLWPPANHRDRTEERAHGVLKPLACSSSGSGDKSSLKHYSFRLQAASDERMLVMLVFRSYGDTVGKLVCMSFDSQIAAGSFGEC